MNIITENMQSIGFSKPFIDTANKINDYFFENPEYAGIQNDISENKDFGEINEKINNFAKAQNANAYEVALAVLMSQLHICRKRYEEKGVAKKLIDDTLYDFIIKGDECLKVYGIYGISVFRWYGCFFDASIIALGRLEYQRVPAPECVDDIPDINLAPGENTVCMHIPSGSPLLDSDVEASLNMAYDYFGNLIKDKTFTVLCSSWLLFPPYKRLMKEGSNLYKFVNRFCVPSFEKQDEFYDSWRVFDTDSKDIEKLPSDTSLRRAFIDYMKSGGEYGYGLGYISYQK